jgi:hypothetical protein
MDPRCGSFECKFCLGESCVPCSRCGDFAICPHDRGERHEEDASAPPTLPELWTLDADG